MKLAILASVLAIGVQRSFGLTGADRCVACFDLGEHIHQRLKETQKRSNEEVAIGGRLGSDGKVIPKKVVLYGKSYKTFYFVPIT